MGMKQRIQSWYVSQNSTDARIRKPVTIPCGICRREYSTANLDKLLAHLGAHFDMRHRFNRCHECRINFVNQADLNEHLRSAKLKRTCGYMFDHKEPCNGHHPQHHGGSKDNNRFDFCYRMQGWEYIQIQPQQYDKQRANENRHQRTSTITSITDFIKLHTQKTYLTQIETPCLPLGDQYATKTTPINPQLLLNTHLLHMTPTSSHQLILSLLQAGASPKSASLHDTLGFTPMHYAAQYCTPDIGAVLIEYGASATIRDRLGNTPLFHAIRAGNGPMAQYLLSRDEVAVSLSEVEESIFGGNEGIAKAVVEGWRVRLQQSDVGVASCDALAGGYGGGEGSDVGRELDELMTGAVRRNQEKMVKVLLECGAKHARLEDVARERGWASVEQVLRQREKGTMRVYLHERAGGAEW